MRERITAASGHRSLPSVCCAASAASTALAAVSKAAQKASPAVLKMCPSRDSMHWRRSASWRGSACAIASRCVSHSRVLPSMSVNRNVTVPLGGDDALGGTDALECDDALDCVEVIRMLCRSIANHNRLAACVDAAPALSRVTLSYRHSHDPTFVIPAKAGIQRRWVAAESSERTTRGPPAFAGTTKIASVTTSVLR